MKMKLRSLRDDTASFPAIVYFFLVLAFASFLFLVFSQFLEFFINFAGTQPHIGGTQTHTFLAFWWGHGWVLIVVLITSIGSLLLYMHMSNYYSRGYSW